MWVSSSDRVLGVVNAEPLGHLKPGDLHPLAQPRVSRWQRLLEQELVDIYRCWRGGGADGGKFP